MLRPVLTLAMLVPTVLLAQSRQPAQGGPRWIVERFFLAPEWPDKAQYYTGEMKTLYTGTRTMGEYGAHVRPESLRPISISPKTAVYGLVIDVDSGRRAEDWYAYVALEDSTWRLSAVRTLALAPLFYMALDSLAGMPARPDSLESLLAGMRLTASSDSALKASFRERRSDFEKIADAFNKESAGSISAAPAGLSAPTASLRSIANSLAKLHLRGAWRDTEVPGCLFIEIGGMIDNEVGFVRCGANSPPSMTPDRFILVDPLVSGWYLYKTT